MNNRISHISPNNDSFKNAIKHFNNLIKMIVKEAENKIIMNTWKHALNYFKLSFLISSEDKYVCSIKNCAKFYE